MLRKLAVVMLPTIVLFMVLCIFLGLHQVPAAALAAGVWVTGLVLGAMFSADPDEASIEALLPALTVGSTDPIEPWKTLYDKATQMHIDTDKGMYQLITVFVPASLLVLSWVVANTRPELITRDHVIVIGSLAVVLVGIATLLKHRLRHYNKLREVYLRGLERRLCDKQCRRRAPHLF